MRKNSYASGRRRQHMHETQNVSYNSRNDDILGDLIYKYAKYTVFGGVDIDWNGSDVRPALRAIDSLSDKDVKNLFRVTKFVWDLNIRYPEPYEVCRWIASFKPKNFFDFSDIKNGIELAKEIYAGDTRLLLFGTNKKLDKVLSNPDFDVNNESDLFDVYAAYTWNLPYCIYPDYFFGRAKHSDGFFVYKEY